MKFALQSSTIKFLLVKKLILKICTAIIILAWIFNPSFNLSSQSCLTPSLMTDHHAALGPESFSSYQGPFYLKLYIYILRRTDKSGGVSQVDVKNSLEQMKTYFEPHNIYFYYGCIDYINNDVYYEDFNMALFGFNDPEDGISILITPGTGGFSSGIGANKVYSSANPVLIAHELGHALGLDHTFNNGKCANGDPLHNELNDGSNCATAGDYVCDTGAAPDPLDSDNFGLVEYHLTYCLFNNINCVDPDGMPYTNVDIDNIMSYNFPCCTRFTDGQGERMRNELRSYPSFTYSAQRNWAYVAENGNISAPHQVDVDIVIAEGAECTISTTLNMAPNTKIIVFPEAQLNILYATIDVGEEDEHCPSNDILWRGIYLHNGDKFKIPSSAYIYGSTIKNARNALNWVFDQIEPAYPARVVGYYSEFINNEIAINFKKLSWNNSSYAIPFKRASKFQGCEFRIDNNYLIDAFNQHVYLTYDNVGLNFYSCFFKNDRTKDPQGDQKAIYSYASNLGIYKIEGDQPLFSNFKIAIDARGGAVNHSFLSNLNVIDADFSNNKIGISTNAANSVNLRLNDFILKDQADHVGVNINGTIGYTISANTFTSLTGSVSNKFGVEIVNSTTESNLIDKNIFTKMGHAIKVVGVNASEISGLQIQCNNISISNYIDILVDENSSVASHQGDPTNPAGNKFSQIAGITGSDFHNDGGNENIRYFYSSINPIENPLSNLNISPSPVAIATDCRIRSVENANIEILDNQYSEFITSYDSILIIYDATINASTKSYLLSLLLTLDTKIDITCNNALQIMNSDSIYHGNTAYRLWLNRKNSFEADLEIAGTYLADIDFLGFTAFRSTIDSRRDLTSEESKDLDLYFHLTDLIVEAIDSVGTEAKLDSTQVETLNSIANSNDRLVAGMAKNILETFYGYDFENVINPRSEDTDELQPFTSLIPTKVVPNPVLDNLKLLFSKGDYLVRLVTLDGRIILEDECKMCSEFNMTTAYLHPGIYFYSIFSGNKVGSGKFFIE